MRTGRRPWDFRGPGVRTKVAAAKKYWSRYLDLLEASWGPGVV